LHFVHCDLTQNYMFVPFEYGAKERVLPCLEDLCPELAVQVLRVRGMDRGRLPDHAVQVDRDLGNLAVPHRVLEDEHDLLGTADGEHGDQDLPASGQDAPEDFLQLLGGLVAGRWTVMIAP